MSGKDRGKKKTKKCNDETGEVGLSAGVKEMRKVRPSIVWHFLGKGGGINLNKKIV